MAQSNFQCPVCGHIDMVQKVSVVAESDVIHRHGEYETYTYPSPLAKSLERPKEPKRDASSSAVLVVGVALLALGIVLLAESSSSGLQVTLLGLVFIILAFLANSRDKKKFGDTFPRWQEADKRWNQLYYCRRDDIIFNPYDSKSEAMPVSKMTEYLYANLPPSQKDLSSQKNEDSSIVITCENCGQKLRIPRKKKNLHVTCPKCKHDFNYEFSEGEPVSN